MSKTSLNAVSGIELKALVPFKISLPMNWDILGRFRCSNFRIFISLGQLVWEKVPPQVAIMK